MGETTFRLRSADGGVDSVLTFVTTGKMYRCGECGAYFSFEPGVRPDTRELIAHARAHGPTLLKIVDVDFMPDEIEDLNADGIGNEGEEAGSGD